MIEEIVKDHKSGNIAYHVALDMITDLGMIQEEAHELLFPPMSDDDFDPDLPFDSTDIMTVDLSKAMSRLERKNYREGSTVKIKNLKITMGEEE